MGPPDEVDAGGTRRHALWGLSILAMVAAVLVSAMVLFGGGRDDAHHRAGPPLPTATYSSPGSRSPSKSTSSTARPSTSARPTPRSTPPSTSAAALVTTAPPTSSSAPPPPPPSSSAAPAPFGLEQIAQAIYQYRKGIAHDFPVTRSQQLMACALVASTCGNEPSGYVRSAAALVEWLRSKAPSSVDQTPLRSCQVGWAEHPEHPAARYYVVILCSGPGGSATPPAPDPSAAPGTPAPTR
jgi:hypothetical protein